MCSDFSLFYFFFYQNKGQARVTLAPPLDPPLLLVFVPYDFNCRTDFIGGTVSNSENGKLSRIIVQWNPAITKCHGTEKNVRYSGVFVIAKTPL